MGVVNVIIAKINVISTLKVNIRRGLTAVQRKQANMSSAPSVLGADRGIPIKRLLLAGRRLRGMTGVPTSRRLSHATLLNVLTMERTLTGSTTSESGHMKLISSASIKNVSLARRFFRGFVRGRGTKHLHSIEVRSYTTDARTVIGRYKVGKCSAALDATYSSTTGTMVANTGLLGRGVISDIIINKASTLDTFAVGKFGSLVVLSSRRYHPFSRSHTKPGLKRKTKCVILRERRSIRSCCYRLTKCTGHGSTRRRATSSRRKGNTCLTVATTLRVTKLPAGTVSCVGTRKAKANGGSTSRDGTFVHLFNRRVPPFDSAGTFANRALTTTNNVRTMLSILTVDRNIVCPGLGFGIPVRRFNLIPMSGFISAGLVGAILSGSFKFKKGYDSLLFAQ